MAIKPILQIGDPRLNQVSVEVKDFTTPELKQLIKDMIDTLNDRIDKSAGLSAPQIGTLQRVIVCNRYDLQSAKSKKNRWEVMINPVITRSSNEKSYLWEGCLSVKDGDLFGEVARAAKITVKYQDAVGESHELACEGFMSHVVQHEIDHLNGVIFLNYVEDPDELLTGKQLDSMLRKKK